MSIFLKIFSTFFIIINTFLVWYCFDIKDIWVIDNYIIDKTNTLNQEEIDNISNKIKEIKQKYQVEIFTLIVPTLNWEDISQVWVDIWQKLWVWKKQTDTWIIILIALNDREWNISTWYWVEWVLPDLLTKKIWEKNFILFRQEKYFQGIYWAIDDMEKYISWDSDFLENKKNTWENSDGIMIFLFLWVLVYSIIFLRKYHTKKQYKKLFIHILFAYFISLLILFAVSSQDPIISNTIAWFFWTIIWVFSGTSWWYSWKWWSSSWWSSWWWWWWGFGGFGWWWFWGWWSSWKW